MGGGGIICFIIVYWIKLKLNIDFEKEYAYCDRYKTLNISLLLSSQYFFICSQNCFLTELHQARPKVEDKSIITIGVAMLWYWNPDCEWLTCLEGATLPCTIYIKEEAHYSTYKKRNLPFQLSIFFRSRHKSFPSLYSSTIISLYFFERVCVHKKYVMRKYIPTLYRIKVAPWREVRFFSN